MSGLKKILRLITAIFFIVAGSNHFVTTDFYVAMMPAYLPMPLFLVFLSGVLEIVLGFLLLKKEFTHIAGWGIIALLIAVFPANIQMAIHSELYPQFYSTILWCRLPAQGLFIAFIYWLAV